MVVITPVNEHFLQYKQQKENVLPELLREPLILREKGSGSKKMADNFLAHSGISEDELQIIARVNDQETIKNLVAGGMGISIISEKAAHNFLQEKRLLVFELPQAFSASTSSTAKIICCQATSRNFSASSAKANYKHNKTSTHRTNPGVLVNFYIFT